MLKVELSRILPASIMGDGKVRALAKSLERHLQAVSDNAKLVLHLPRLDELDHELLNILANQLHVDFFEPEEMSLPVKRDLIRNSLLDHRIKGTRAAVENLLNKIVGAAAVSEWYEYGGRKFYFRVKVKELKDFGDEGETFIRLINATKNARSWLDDLIFDLSKHHPDTILNIGQLELTQGAYLFELKNRFSDSESLIDVESELTRGRINFGLSFNHRSFTVKKSLSGLRLTHGRIKIDADINRGDIETERAFERYIRQKWAEFKSNPVVEHYKHHGHELDGETDPDEPEVFPLDQDFLRLYFKFEETDRLRYLTILNPRLDLTGKDIRAVGEVTLGNILHMRKGYPTTGLIRALYIRKTEEKIL